jgi:hypothetical protein
MDAPRPSFVHLIHLTDGVGIFEHAKGTEPRVEHGYCTDDNARLLVVASREPDPSASVRELARVSMRFVADAQAVDGRIRNRRSVHARWQDRPGVEDCWGRALWGLGTAAGRDPSPMRRIEATARFDHSARKRSPWPHAMAFAGLGAAEVLRAQPTHALARWLLADAAEVNAGADIDDDWRWPEPRLTYANAARAEVLVAAGVALDRGDWLRLGLDRLEWLVEQETRDGHLSVTPVGGWARGEPRPGFDQQPIEVAALADACACAAVATGDTRWARAVGDAVAWFLGVNDSGAVMGDPASGGGFDGLTPDGVNVNQGAESTLAYVATMQHARNLVVVGT